MNWLIVGLIGASVAVYSMIDLVTRKAPMKKKLMWFPIIIVLPILGPFLYFLFRPGLR